MAAPLGSSLNPFTAVRDLKRAKYLLSVVFRYGFEDVVRRLHLPFEPLAQRLSRVRPDLSLSERIRLMVEELGPTFIKLGQFLSMRPDILPADLIAELGKLQDDVPPVDFPRVRTEIERALGKKIGEVFSAFDEKPFASASIAQVYRARLRGQDRPVVCKVRRPGIEAAVVSDFHLIAFAARQAHERIGELRHFNLPQAVEEARKALLQELDFEIEKENIYFYRRLAVDSPEVIMPEVEEEVSGRSLLVMGEVDGLKAARLQGIELRKKAAGNLVGACFRQMMIFGFFHADPHGGNIRFDPEGRVIFFDWGSVGRLSWKMRFKLAEFLEALVGGDPVWAVDCGLALSGDIDVENREGLEEEMLILLDRFRHQALRNVNIGRALLQVFEMLGRWRIRLNSHYLLVARTLMDLEGLVRELDPEFDLMANARSYLLQVNAERLQPGRVWSVLRRNLYQTFGLLEGLPGRLNNIITKLEEGKLTIVYQYTGLDRMMSTLKSAANRLVIGMILSALLVGSSLVILARLKPTVVGVSVLGLLGYLIAAVLGLWIIYISYRDR